jgi:hypothetical protein
MTDKDSRRIFYFMSYVDKQIQSDS